MSVLTLNLWNVSEPLDARMALVRAGLVALRPDFATFQEVVVRRGDDQAARVLDGTGYDRVFGPAFGWTAEGAMVSHQHAEEGFGNLIASRWPILESEVRTLPGVDGTEPRTVVGATVATPAGVLPILTTHLDWEFDHGWVRERQVRVVAGFARELAARSELPPIVTGDFNAHPDSTEMRYLRGLASLGGTSTYFQDAWETAGPGGRGVTWDNRNRFASVAHEPDRRVDYVLVGPPDTLGRGTIVGARLVFDEPEDGVFASDHFGLLAVVRV